MQALMGWGIVIICVIGGYLIEGGNLSLIINLPEFFIIGGAGIGAYICAYGFGTLKSAIGDFQKLLSGKGTYQKEDYLELLQMLSDVFNKIRKDGLISIEADVDSPEKSAIFPKYAKFFNNHHALNFVTDTLRTIMTTTIEPHQLESLLESEIEAHHSEAMHAPMSIVTIAESFPGIGIVAAVLGVILTMLKISEPPEVLGHSIGSALVGTFLGVLLCYGFVGPLGHALTHAANAQTEYLNVLKAGLMAFIHGSPPAIAVEFGRRIIPGHQKPTFMEVEEAIRQKK